MNKIIVDASKKSFSFGLSELLHYRDLFLILAYRDLKVRYAQTFLGLLWAIIQPLTTLFIFTLIFGRVIKVDTGGIPYPLFAMIGMLGWSYFSFVMSQSGSSVINAQEMIKKIYFPRLVIPLSKAFVGFVDYLVTIVFIIGLLIYFKTSVSSGVVFLPLVFLLNVAAALAIGIWLSALTIRYRDFQHVLPFLVQIGLYVTPVGYPSSLVSEKLPEWAQAIYYLNPVAGIVDWYRWCILGNDSISQYTLFSLAVIVLLLPTGIIYFKKVERVMADII